MVLFEGTHGLRLSMASGGGRLQCMDRVVQNTPHPIGPREIDQPPPLRDIASRHRGGTSGQAMASFVHLNSVSVFHSVSVSTASLRAAATAALAKPRRPASRTAQLFSAENFCTVRSRSLPLRTASSAWFHRHISRCGRTNPFLRIDTFKA